MFSPFMHRFQQTLQTLCERHIALGAAKPSGLLEVCLGKAAMRAFNFRADLRNLLGGAQAKQQVGKRGSRGIIDPLFLATFLAQIDLLHLIPNDLGQVHFGFFFFADAAEHSGYQLYRLIRARSQCTVWPKTKQELEQSLVQAPGRIDADQNR